MQDAALSRFSLLDLFDKRQLENIQETISQATGLAITTLDYKGDMITKATYFPEFCLQMRKKKDLTHSCRSSDGFGVSQSLVNSNNYIYFCPYSLLEVTVPIIVRGQFMGAVLAGKVKCDTAPDEIARLEYLMKYSRAQNLNNRRLQNLYDDIQIINFTVFFHFVELITMIMSQLSARERTANTEPELGQEQTLIKAIATPSHLESAISLKIAERAALRARRNLYSLRNVLSSISNLAVLENASKTAEITIMLAEYLSDLELVGEFIGLAKEMENVKHYLKMQQIRFGDAFDYTVEMPENLYSLEMPSYILMPFVERAVFFGWAAKEDGILKVSVTVDANETEVTIKINDNGAGLNGEELSRFFEPYHGHYEGPAIEAGVAGARRRLTELFGLDYDVKINNYPGRGTESIIRYPTLLSKRLN